MFFSHFWNRHYCSDLFSLFSLVAAKFLPVSAREALRSKAVFSRSVNDSYIWAT